MTVIVVQIDGNSTGAWSFADVILILGSQKSVLGPSATVEVIHMMRSYLNPGFALCSLEELTSKCLPVCVSATHTQEADGGEAVNLILELTRRNIITF